MRGIIKTVHRVFDNHQVFLKKLSGFLIYSDIRRIFSHQKQHQNIDPSYKTGLDFVCVCVCVCFLMGKPISQQNSRLFQKSGVNLDGKVAVLYPKKYSGLKSVQLHFDNSLLPCVINVYTW